MPVEDGVYGDRHYVTVETDEGRVLIPHTNVIRIDEVTESATETEGIRK